MKKKRFYYPLIRSVVQYGNKRLPHYFGSACGAGSSCIYPFRTCADCVFNLCPE